MEAFEGTAEPEGLQEAPYEREGDLGRITLTLDRAGWEKVVGAALVIRKGSFSSGVRAILRKFFEVTRVPTIAEFEAAVLATLPQKSFEGIADGLGLGGCWGRHSRSLARELRRMKLEGKLG